MIQIPDAPDIARALRTGYPYPEPDRPGEPLFYTDDGVMDKEEVIEYMTEYVRKNTEDAAAAFGIEMRRPE